MPVKKDNFVIWAVYNNRNYQKQLYISLLSMMYRKTQMSPPIKLLLYTDTPKEFRLFFGKLVYVQDIKRPGLLSEDKFKTKLNVMRDFILRYEANGLFVDTDTYFQKTPDDVIGQLSKGNYILNSHKDFEMNSIEKETAMIGIPADDPAGLLKNSTTKADLLKLVDKQKPFISQPDMLFHYKKNREAAQKHINAFLAKHYYNELGELMQITGLWTPDKWGKDNQFKLI